MCKENKFILVVVNDVKVPVGDFMMMTKYFSILFI